MTTEFEKLKLWVNNWWKGDTHTASYHDMVSSKYKANQLVCVWHEKFQLLHGKITDEYKLTARMLYALDNMIRYALEDKDKEMKILEERYITFINRWTLHDKDGERWSEHEWRELLIKDLAGIGGGSCLTCEELGDSNITEYACPDCKEYKCDDHTECAGCEL